jgi:hypothetical protein
MESAKLNCLVGEKYGLKEERFDKLVDLVCSLFFKEIKLVDLIKTSKELFGFDDVKAKAFSLDIAGIRVLVVKDWLEDVEAYIKSLGGKIEDYASYADQQKKALVEEERFFKEQLSEEIVDSVADTDKKESFEDANTPLQFDVSKEKADSVKNFKEYIAELLKAENFDIAKEYNDILLEILLDGGNSAKDDLEKALYANQEKITTANFILDGKVSVGTVANWIKHFLALKGSDMFDNIVVSSFLVQSPNAKILNSDEKAIVRRLLLLYRNLKFFPQSMPNQTGEGWEIIPTETEEDAPRTKIVPKKEVVTPDAKLAELEDRLSKALAGSLQRRVIEEEIKKIKNKK